MTEDEAKMKWCPFARIATNGDGSAFNRWHYDDPVWSATGAPDGRAQCIASACMAWRWVHDDELPTAPGEELKQTGHGYCGLAGYHS